MRKQYVNLKLQSNEYRTLSSTDPLTGVLNHADIKQEVERCLASPEQRQGLCVMLFDIDHFKRVSDVRGHDAGDRVLKTFSEIVSSNVRTQD